VDFEECSMLKPKVSEYRVVRGDCLWNIAADQYGNPMVWPEIAELNKLPDPDLILIGMTLKLGPVHDRRYHPRPPDPGSKRKVNAKPPQVIGVDPSRLLRLDHPNALDMGPPTKGPATPPQIAPSHPPAQLSPTRTGTGTALARPLLFPAVRYKFDDLAAITIDTPVATFTLRFIGEISLQQKGTMTEVELSQRGTLTGKMRTEYDSKFADLVGQVKVGLNSETKAVQVACNLSVAAKIDGKVFAITQYEFIPPNRFKYSYKPRPIQGEWNGLVFSGNVGIELEVIIKKPDAPPPAEPVQSPERNRVPVWAWVAAGALVVAGACIIVADVAKDVGTLGAGTVESPLSFAAAAALFTQAAQMTH
jgi:hypothetical protein